MKKIIAWLCSLGVLVNGAAFAAPIDSITQDEQGRIEITGTLVNPGRFTVQMLEPSVSAEDITDGNVAEKIHAIGDFETDESGSYKEKLTMKKTVQDMGIYTVRVKGDSEDEVYEMTFKFFDSGSLTTAFNNFKSAQSAEKAYEVASNNAERFAINQEPYNSLTDASKKRVTAVVFGNMKDDWVLENLREEYKKQSFAEAVSSGTNAVENLISGADILGISQDGKFETFINMNGANQKEVAEKLKGSDLTNEDIAKNNFAEAVFLIQLKNTEGIANVKELLTDNINLFEEGALEKYLSAKDTSAVNSALVGKNFESIEAVLKKINETMGVENKNNGSGSGGSSGGSGSSGSSGGTFTGLGVNPNAIQNAANVQNVAFTDLDGVEWAKPAIEYLASKSVINGRGNGIFAPSENVTREEFVKMLVLAFGVENKNAQSEFSDVSADDWSYPYVSVATQLRLVNGISEDLFGKGRNITRQDMAVLLWRFVKYKGADLPANAIVEFTDKGLISNYAVEAISALRAADIISGMPGGEYKPVAPCTRAEAAKIIYTALLSCGLI